ncbi:MAG: hypothetical protein JO117_04425 [Verrucomicrobia bacterium]|nr:hypothetical protein [Verrucomicrobiota bacterium]MBV9659043.1 hypothetical protein [Verrucomicrobiota bacterium]
MPPSSSPSPFPPSAAAPRPPQSRRNGQFSSLRASSLYCNKCRAAMPVRERLLLVLPGKEIYDYLCTGCASSVGQREVTAAAKSGSGNGASSLLVP